MQVFKIDTNGFYLEDVILKDSDPVPADCVTVQPTQGLHKPQYANGEWVEGKLASDILSGAKSAKLEELKTKCAEVIQSGFTSTALGTSHTYPSDPTSMIYFNATHNRFQSDATFTQVNWQTIDSGYLVHTKAQFEQAYHDGHQFGIDQEAHLAQLITDLLSATTVDAVNAITW